MVTSSREICRKQPQADQHGNLHKNHSHEGKSQGFSAAGIDELLGI